MKTTIQFVLALAWLLAPTLATPFSATALTVPPAGLTLTLTISNNNLIFSFPTTSTNYYGLQMRPDFSQPWTNIQAGIQGYGTVRSVTISNAVAAGRGFYRLLLQPPPTQLLLSQSAAFAIIGYDCGGISEQIYAIGFNSTNGYLTGNVDLKTICSCGKDCSSTHTASATVTWDLAGNVVSAITPATGAPANPTFIATGRFNDILYNAGANAYLIVPVPAAPTGVTAVQSGDQFQVSWTPNGVNPVAITSSTLTATPVNNSTASTLTTTATGPVTNGVIPTLQPATSYQITVASTTLGGSGPASTPISVTTSPATIPPSAPTNVVAQWASPAADPGPNTLIASWQAADPGNSPVDEYLVTITSDTASTLTNSVSGTTLTAYFNVDSNPSWSGTVQAHNAAGWGPPSAVFNLGGL